MATNDFMRVSESLLEPDEIVEDLGAALEQFEAIQTDLAAKS